MGLLWRQFDDDMQLDNDNINTTERSENNNTIRLKSAKNNTAVLVDSHSNLMKDINLKELRQMTEFDMDVNEQTKKRQCN